MEYMRMEQLPLIEPFPPRISRMVECEDTVQMALRGRWQDWLIGTDREFILVRSNEPERFHARFSVTHMPLADIMGAYLVAPGSLSDGEFHVWAGNESDADAFVRFRCSKIWTFRRACDDVNSCYSAAVKAGRVPERSKNGKLYGVWPLWIGDEPHG